MSAFSRIKYVLTEAFAVISSTMFIYALLIFPIFAWPIAVALFM